MLFTLVFQAPGADTAVGFIHGAKKVPGAVLGAAGATAVTISLTHAGDDRRDPAQILARAAVKVRAVAVARGWSVTCSSADVPIWARKIIAGLDIVERDIRAGQRKAKADAELAHRQSLADAALAADKARERARGLDTRHERDSALYALRERVKVVGA